MSTPRWITWKLAAPALLSAVAAVALAPGLVDAILVAPHAVFIDHRTRSGQMFLVNTGGVAEEVVIELKYGYPTSDSVGGVYVQLIDQPDSAAPDATPWLRAFPRRTVVQPGERQTVRLLAQPPADLPDGEYWSRIIVTSREVRPPVAANDSAIRAGISVELRTILSATYRKGAVRTGITMTEFAPQLTRDSAIVWLALRREGNAAWLGTVALDAHDTRGRTVGRLDTPVAVFYEVRRRFAFPLEVPAAAGEGYTFRVRLSTAREDLQRTDVLQAPAFADSARVELRP